MLGIYSQVFLLISNIKKIFLKNMNFSVPETLHESMMPLFVDNDDNESVIIIDGDEPEVVVVDSEDDSVIVLDDEYYLKKHNIKPCKIVVERLDEQQQQQQQVTDDEEEFPVLELHCPNEFENVSEDVTPKTLLVDKTQRDYVPFNFKSGIPSFINDDELLKRMGITFEYDYVSYETRFANFKRFCRCATAKVFVEWVFSDRYYCISVINPRLSNLRLSMWVDMYNPMANDDFFKKKVKTYFGKKQPFNSQLSNKCLIDFLWDYSFLPTNNDDKFRDRFFYHYKNHMFINTNFYDINWPKLSDVMFSERNITGIYDMDMFTLLLRRLEIANHELDDTYHPSYTFAFGAATYFTSYYSETHQTYAWVLSMNRVIDEDENLKLIKYKILDFTMYSENTTLEEIIQQETNIFDRFNTIYK